MISVRSTFAKKKIVIFLSIFFALVACIGIASADTFQYPHPKLTVFYPTQDLIVGSEFPIFVYASTLNDDGKNIHISSNLENGEIVDIKYNIGRFSSSSDSIVFSRDILSVNDKLYAVIFIKPKDTGVLKINTKFDIEDSDCYYIFWCDKQTIEDSKTFEVKQVSTNTPEYFAKMAQVRSQIYQNFNNWLENQKIKQLRGQTVAMWNEGIINAMEVNRQILASVIKSAIFSELPPEVEVLDNIKDINDEIFENEDKFSLYSQQAQLDTINLIGDWSEYGQRFGSYEYVISNNLNNLAYHTSIEETSWRTPNWASVQQSVVREKSIIDEIQAPISYSIASDATPQVIANFAKKRIDSGDFKNFDVDTYILFQSLADYITVEQEYLKIDFEKFTNNYPNDNIESKDKTQLKVNTLDPIPISSTSVTLKGELTSLGTGPCDVWFVYGIPPNFGMSTEPKKRMTGTGTFESVLSGLQPGTTYQYRSVASTNDVDWVYGPGKTFTMSGSISSTQPTVTTTDPTSVSPMSATLTGMLTGGSGSYNIWFEYGPSPSLGSATDPATISTPTPFSQTITGLQPGTVYYYRMFASKDKRYDGNEITFTTTGAKPNLENKFVYTTAGIYTLDSDLIHSTPYGIKIEASSVVIDGNSHTISPQSKMTPSFGVWIAEKDVNGNAITDVQIKNLRIKNEDTGIFMSGLKNSIISNVIASENNRAVQLINADHITVQNSEFMNNQQGIMVDNSQYITISKNNVHDNQISGIHLYSGSKNNAISENTLNNNNYGISMGDVYFTSVDRNTINNNRVHGVDIHAGSSNNNIVNNKLLNNDIFVCSDCLNNKLIDNSEIKPSTEPIIKTSDPVSVSSTSATFTGSLTGGSGSYNVWFEYGPSSSHGSTTNPVAISSPTPFSQTIPGLQPGTVYYYRMVGSKEQMYYGNEVTFTTVPSTEIDNPPILYPIGSQEVDAGSTLIFTISAYDPDGDPLLYEVTGTLPAGATFDYNSLTFRWTPMSDQIGIYVVYFSTFEKYHSGIKDTERVQITVNQGTNTINHPPQFYLSIPDPTVQVGQQVRIKPVAEDEDGDSMTYSWTPTREMIPPPIINEQTGLWTWTPSIEGTYIIHFSVKDEHGLIGNIPTTVITVKEAVNQPPAFQLIGNVWGSGGSGGNQVISVKLNLGLAPGSTPFDMTKTTYSLTSSGGQSQGYIADTFGGDNILDAGEQFCIKFDYPQGIPPNTQFIININNPQSAPMVIYRTTPPNIPVGVITFY